MTLNELCAWLRANSSGVYRPAADAASQIEMLAEALTDIMAGMKDHDIAAETGFYEKDCARIAFAREQARQLMRDMAARDA